MKLEQRENPGRSVFREHPDLRGNLARLGHQDLQAKMEHEGRQARRVTRAWQVRQVRQAYRAPSAQPEAQGIS